MFQFPTTASEWIDIANDFGLKHQFWNCVGAIDGKHIAITKPYNSGSEYFNYKGFYSIVLLAVVNANKEFIMVDVGINGRISDGGVLFYSKFGELFERNALSLPDPSPLPNSSEPAPFVFIADEAFALNVNLMKPYSLKLPLTNEQREYNKRLSRARVVVENAFGILGTRFGVFQKAIHLEPEKATKITLACCYLHNFLSKNSGNYMASIGENQEEPPFLPLLGTSCRNSTKNAKKTRDMFCKYFSNSGLI